MWEEVQGRVGRDVTTVLRGIKNHVRDETTWRFFCHGESLVIQAAWNKLSSVSTFSLNTFKNLHFNNI